VLAAKNSKQQKPDLSKLFNGKENVWLSAFDSDVALLLQGCVIVALQGCVIVALQGCVIVALHCKVA
jgi:hypothetical protein